MKRNVLIGLFLFALMPFVSAQYFGGGFWYGTQQVIDSLVFNLEPLLRALLGGYDWTGYLLFEKTILFILISIIVGVVLGNLPFFKDFKHKGILRLVAILIGLLGVRNLNYVWVSTLVIQYQALFITVAGILPFLIYFYFTKSISESWVRKTAWIFYAVIYIGLWTTTELETYGTIYLWGALSALFYAFFLDTWFNRWLAVQEAKRGDATKRDQLVGTLKKEIEDIRLLEGNGHLSKSSADHLIKVKQEVIKSLMKS